MVTKGLQSRKNSIISVKAKIWTKLGHSSWRVLTYLYILVCSVISKLLILSKMAIFDKGA